MTTIYTTAEKLAKLPPRNDFDFYPTPRVVCDAAIKLLSLPSAFPLVLDVGAGTGVWGEAVCAANGLSMVSGVDIRELPKHPAYADWIQADFRLLKPSPVHDAVIGNPPYNHALQFVKLGLEWLKDGGQLMFLLRLNFLASQQRHAFFQKNPPRKVWVSVNRISFTGDGKANATEYGLFVWQKGWTGSTELGWFDYKAVSL